MMKNLFIVAVLIFVSTTAMAEDKEDVSIATLRDGSVVVSVYASGNPEAPENKKKFAAWKAANEKLLSEGCKRDRLLSAPDMKGQSISIRYTCK